LILKVGSTGSSGQADKHLVKTLNLGRVNEFDIVGAKLSNLGKKSPFVHLSDFADVWIPNQQFERTQT
jgi:hypothetical protein